MCGRYLFFDGKNEGLQKLIEKAEKSLPEQEFRQISLYEVFPGQKAFAIIYDPRDNRYRLTDMFWGYRSSFNKGVINARSETADTSSFFAGSHRCVIPASGYYEWSKEPKIRYYFSTGSTIYIASFARRESDGLHFVILTEQAGKPESVIHDRQPVLFDKEHAMAWCRGEDYKRMLEASLQKRFMTKSE